VLTVLGVSACQVGFLGMTDWILPVLQGAGIKLMQEAFLFKNVLCSGSVAKYWVFKIFWRL